jgi:ubiquinone/menaquinone biosynthesis C-methylase UbiE
MNFEMSSMKRDNMLMENRVRDRYDAMSSAYASTGKLFGGHRKDTTFALEIRSDDCILDLGCGPGVNFANILQYLGKTGSLVGLDFSSKMIERAELLIQNNKWKNVTTVVSDAAKLPFADGKFDHIIATYSISVIPDYIHAIDEIERVLKPGGSVAILDGTLGKGLVRFINPLIKLMNKTPMSDITRPIKDEIAKRFMIDKVVEYDLGFTFLAVAHKKGKNMVNRVHETERIDHV